MKQNTFLILAFSLLMTACGPKLTGSSPLFSGSWVLLEMNTVPVQVSGTEKDAQLKFDYKAKQVTGRGGCNSLNGTYEADAKALKFGGLATTRMYCEDQRFEDKFLENLRNVRKYGFAGENLVLKDQKDKALLVFKSRK